MGKQSDLKIDVSLDDQMLPEKITWYASDSGMTAPSPCKAFLFSVWDEQNAETLRIDLWTKEMRQDEMDTFFFQTLMTMADTYQRANNQQEIVDLIREFSYAFGEKTGLIKRG